MRAIRKYLPFLVCVTAGLCSSAVAFAQVDRGSITGTVSDPTGAVIPGVDVNLVETETGVRYRGDKTNEQGVYRILNLPVGKYSLTFTRDGFKTYDRNGVTVAMSQNVTLNAKLMVGSRAESGRPARQYRQRRRADRTPTDCRRRA
jgi:hypothetical protein